MFDSEIKIETIQKVTGYVLPVGNGAVGKSSLSLALDLEKEAIPQVAKSMNLEFGYVLHKLEINHMLFHVMQQFLVPPGQKESEGMSGGRSYEKVIETYRFILKQIDVVLLSFKLTDVDSFNDLEYWVDQSVSLGCPTTQFFLVGTHLDMDHAREVSPKMIQTGRDFVQCRIKELAPDWIGQVESFEISNTNRQNLTALRNAISIAILKSKKLIN
jgi:hypothetical protein